MYNVAAVWLHFLAVEVKAGLIGCSAIELLPFEGICNKLRLNT